MDVYLEMSHEERGKILKLARDRGAAIIDCHSHPHSYADVWFSPSDRHGITDFAQYVRWKLDGKPFAALVWGEASVDGVVWQETFEQAQPLDLIRVGSTTCQDMRPTGSWFRRPARFNRFSTT